MAASRPSQLDVAVGRTSGNPEADEDDDCQHCARTQCYGAREIKQNGLDTHRHSVNRTLVIRNVTLVSTLVRMSPDV